MQRKGKMRMNIAKPNVCQFMRWWFCKTRSRKKECKKLRINFPTKKVEKRE